MKELAREKFLTCNCNCAESVLLSANEKCGLNIAEGDVALISGFGGGMGCGQTCGALCGAVAALGKAKVTGSAHTTTGLREDCAKMVANFEAEFGSLACSVVKAKYFKPDVRCAYVVEKTAEMLEEMLK